MGEDRHAVLEDRRVRDFELGRDHCSVSIAVNAALRARAGMMARPTSSRSVLDGAPDAAAIPSAKKQASASQNSSTPADFGPPRAGRDAG